MAARNTGNIGNTGSIDSNNHHHQQTHITPHKWGRHTVIATPPRRPFSSKVKNPFERTLVESLGSSICSPGMFKIRESSGSFKWDIEHVSMLAPTEIVACSSQFESTPDPVLELKATRAIEKFFSQEVIVPSPMDEAPKRVALLGSVEEENGKCDVFTQTMLTIPPILPPETEELLKPFFTFTMDQNTYNEADLSANASLRRKLCFEINHTDDDTSDDENNKHPKISPERADDNSKTSHTHSPLWNNLFKNVTTPPSYDSTAFMRSSDERMVLKSPSLSPISKTPKRPSIKHSETMTNFDDSPFSQSTPEKTHYKSESDIFDSLDVDMKDRSDIDEFVRLRAEKRSQSELSLNSLCRSRSAIKLDFCMESSNDNSLHLFSSNGIETDHDSTGEDNTKSLEHVDQLWKMELISESNEMNLEKIQEIRQPVVDFKSQQEDDLLHYHTPNKNAGSRSFRKKSSKYNHCSPIKTSFGNEISSRSSDYKLFPNDNQDKPQWIFQNRQSDLEEMVTFKSKQLNSYKNNECDLNTSNCDVTMCNTSKFDSLSTTNWRRFDSGFNEEASTDLSQQLSSQEFKQPATAQCSTFASFQEENKENVYFGESFYTTYKKIPKHDSMSFSEINSDDISQFTCNYSSTPSKNKQKQF